MRGRRGVAGLTASPLLVGAVAVLVTLVAVFLAYNANSGLPFVPSYELKAELPNAANLVRGNEVRVGGARVGTIARISAEEQGDGGTYAQLQLKLDKQLEPLPVDSTLVVRPRSALGLKYIELTPGSANAGYKAGATIPLRQARPLPVELDDVLNMFTAPARTGMRRALDGFGEGFSGRGQGLNSAIEQLRPLLDDLEPVARNLSAPRTRLERLLRALGDAAGEVAPVAATQAALFVNLDTTFAALAQVARPFIQSTISESPPTLDVATRQFPQQRPFINNGAALFRELRPGVATLPHSAPILADALELGADVLPKTPPFNTALADVFDALAEFAEDPLVERGIAQLTRVARSAQPTVRFITPAQTTCNYITLWFRNIASLLSEGDRNGTWQRFIIIATSLGPNNEGGPASAPANGGGPQAEANHLHQNPYPNTAAPGQPRECEAANEPYAVGRNVIGNVPGNQGTNTDGKGGPSPASAGGGR